MTIELDDRTTLLKCNKCSKTVAEIQYSWDLYEGFHNFDIICESCKDKINNEKKQSKCYCGNIPRTTCKECNGPICLMHLWKKT